MFDLTNIDFNRFRSYALASLFDIFAVAVLMVIVLAIAESSGPAKALKVIGAGVLVALVVLVVTT